MTETERSSEKPLAIEKIAQGDCVLYATDIRANSFFDATQNEAQQLLALTEISKKITAAKEKIIGTALLSTSSQDNWPASKLRSTLIVIGTSPITHPREPLSKEAQRDYKTQATPDVLTGTAMLAPEWRNLYKGTLSKEVLKPVVYFADEAVKKLGKNFNIPALCPVVGVGRTYMMATRRSEIPFLNVSRVMQP